MIFLVRGEGRGINTNLQLVIVGNWTITGFLDTGADITLARPEVLEQRYFFPGESLTIPGVEGAHSCVPLSLDLP